jgi:hypothetical protein
MAIRRRYDQPLEVDPRFLMELQLREDDRSDRRIGLAERSSDRDFELREFLGRSGVRQGDDRIGLESRRVDIAEDDFGLRDYSTRRGLDLREQGLGIEQGRLDLASETSGRTQDRADRALDLQDIYQGADLGLRQRQQYLTEQQIEEQLNRDRMGELLQGMFMAEAEEERSYTRDQQRQRQAIRDQINDIEMQVGTYYSPEEADKAIRTLMERYHSMRSKVPLKSEPTPQDIFDERLVTTSDGRSFYLNPENGRVETMDQAEKSQDIRGQVWKAAVAEIFKGYATAPLAGSYGDYPLQEMLENAMKVIDRFSARDSEPQDQGMISLEDFQQLDPASAQRLLETVPGLREHLQREYQNASGSFR